MNKQACYKATLQYSIIDDYICISSCYIMLILKFDVQLHV